MVPLYISECFGVLHPAGGRRGALICGALSDEALNAYRPFVFLAEQLAAAEIATLRLSYYGTGDSAGSDDGTDRFAQWLAGVEAGVAWLRSHGADTVTLIGHRVGATLAARVAGNCDAVDSLVLLNPISGRQFLHELTLAARISQRVWQTSHPVDDGTWFESHGLRIDRPTRDALNALDLRKLPRRPAAQALLLEQEMRPATQQAVEALQRLGTATTAEAYDDLGRLLRDSHQAEVPAPAFGRVVRWIRALPVAAGTTAAADVAPTAPLTVGTAQETPVHFGSGNRLFGILSLPAWLAPDAPALLIANTSANPRWGNARIGVDLARRLAADGIAVLRMDASGMGDSAPQTGDVGRPYADTVTRDLLDAAEELARRTRRPVAVLGICSGAYHALQAARRDTRVAGLVLVNLQRFVWHEGDPPDAVRRTDLRPTSFYLRNIFGLQAWRRLLRADFDVANLLRVLATRVVRRAIAGIDPLLTLLFRGATRVGRVRQAVQALGRRSVPILYVLGCNDPGIEELAEYFGRDGWRLRQQPKVTVRLLADADHTLGAAKVRAELIEQIRRWCHEEWSATESFESCAVSNKRSGSDYDWTGTAMPERHSQV